jgi:diguanylate cyclase (GGDEF)-like protein/PAS domain S-box-containing protein
MGTNDEPSYGFYRTILDDLRDVVFRADAEGLWQFLNPAWTDLTGFEVAATLGRPFLDYVHPDDRERSLAQARALMTGRQAVCRHQVRFRTTQGTSRWVEVHARPALDADGCLTGISGTLSDFTERKQLEDSLQREKERAQITLQSIGEGVVVTAADGRIHLMNSEAERLLGWDQATAVGRPLPEVFRVTADQGQPAWQDPAGCDPDPCPGGCAGDNAWLERADGAQMAVAWSAAPVTGPDRAGLGCVVVFRDVTAQRTLQQQMAYQATHDALTGLLNRAALQEAIAHEAAGAERDGRPLSLILLDLDRFKIANDNYGHAVGDRVLVAVAERIQRHVRDADWFGRWGGEEFLCLLPGTLGSEAVRIAERVRADIMEGPVELAEATIPMTASFGVAAFPEDAGTTEDLIRTADTRLYEAKRAGRNRVEAGREGDTLILPMGGRLQRALDGDRILPAYQPIVDLSTGEAVAEEALARVLEPDGTVLPAGQFIEAASHLQMVHRIDEVLLARTMQRCARMLLGGRGMDHFVNISTELLRHRERVDGVLEHALEMCERCGTRLGSDKPLVIEITEREFLEDTREVHRILGPFLDYGFRIAVDDFGSGYSSFRYLADLPVSFLKIEGDLVRRAIHEPRVRAILCGIRDIAGDLELTTIAEMVEDEATAEFLREIGIDLAQGFHFARPALAEAHPSA